MKALTKHEIELLQSLALKLLVGCRTHALPEAVARVLDVTPGTLKKWRKSGKGPATKVLFGQVLYDVENLWEFANISTHQRRRIRAAK